MRYPEPGVTVNVRAVPAAVDRLPDGLMLPPAPALAVTV